MGPPEQVGDVKQRRQALGHTDRQRAAVQTLHIVDHLPHGRGRGRRQHTLDFDQERAPGLCNFHAACCADEQSGLEFFLQCADSCGAAGLHNVQPGRGAGKILFGGDRDAILKLSQICGTALSKRFT